MRFIQYANQDFWWKWPEGGMKVFNINGGWHEIDENNPNFMYGIMIEADSWADLMEKTGWCPWATKIPRPHMWISPNGEMYECDDWGGHGALADRIVEYVLNTDPDTLDFDSSDYLIECFNWIKVTTGPMRPFYTRDGMYDHLKGAQKRAYDAWCATYPEKNKKI